MASSSNGAPAVSSAKDASPPAGPDADDFEAVRGALAAMRSMRLVGEHDGDAGVAQRVGELVGRPPRVQRHDDGADERRAPERHDELGQVAHGDGDAVTGPDTERGLQLARQAAGLASHVGEGQALVLEDDVDQRFVRRAHLEHVDDGAWRADEVAQRDAVDHHRFDLERPPGADERLEPRVVAVDRCDAGIGPQGIGHAESVMRPSRSTRGSRRSASAWRSSRSAAAAPARRTRRIAALEARDPLAAELLQLLGERVGIVDRSRELHHRADRLAHLGVGNADDRDVGDRGVHHQHVLDLARVDVHAARDDHVRDPVGEVEVALGVEPADVAERRPAAVVEGRRGLLAVAVVLERAPRTTPGRSRRWAPRCRPRRRCARRRAANGRPSRGARATPPT